MKKAIIALIMIVFLDGCQVYRNYRRPDIAVSYSLYRDSVYSGDTSSMAALSWKELFTDTCLRRLIDTGIVRNSDLRIAFLKTQEAEAALLSSRLAFLPSVSLTPEGSLSRYGGGETSASYNIRASASWEIDLFGKLRNSMKEAEAVLYQNRAYCQAVQTQLVATIADSYYSLLMLDRQLEISERTLRNRIEYIRTLEALKINGTVDESDIAQAKAGKLQVESSVLALKQQICSLENSLSVLLGNAPGPIARGTLEGQSFPEEVSLGVPLQLLSNRPDVRQAEWALAQAYYVTNQARASFYPSVTLSGLIGWTNNAGAGIVNPGVWLMNAVGSLVQPLFNRGENMARLKISKAQQEEALVSFRQALLDAGAEVNDALVQWQTARDRQRLVEDQVMYLQQAVKSKEMLMEYGSTTYLEVLTAQQSLLEAELSAAEEQFSEIQGVIKLYHALGGGVR